VEIVPVINRRHTLKTYEGVWVLRQPFLSLALDGSRPRCFNPGEGGLGKVKVKLTLQPATKAQRGSSGTALLSFNLGATWGGWLTPRPLPLYPPPPGGRTRYLLYWDWVSPRDSLVECRKSRPTTGFDPPTDSEDRLIPDPVWTFRTRQKLLHQPAIEPRLLVCATRSLYQLSYPGSIGLTRNILVICVN
jgi:hypothetical protein